MPELRARSAAKRDDAVALIGMLTSVESWDQFRARWAECPVAFGSWRIQRARRLQSCCSDGLVGDRILGHVYGLTACDRFEDRDFADVFRWHVAWVRGEHHEVGLLADRD